MPEFHHGKLYSISASVPNGFEIETIDAFVPTWSLINRWKSTVNAHKVGHASDSSLESEWGAYTANFKKLLSDRSRIIEKLISKLAIQDCTLLCWEKNTALYHQCHRHIVSDHIRALSHKLWGGEIAERTPDCYQPSNIARDKTALIELSIPPGTPVAVAHRRNNKTYWIGGFVVVGVTVRREYLVQDTVLTGQKQSSYKPSIVKPVSEVPQVSTFKDLQRSY